MALPINIEYLIKKQKIESNRIEFTIYEGCGDTVILNVPINISALKPTDIIQDCIK